MGPNYQQTGIHLIFAEKLVAYIEKIGTDSKDNNNSKCTTKEKLIYMRYMVS